ncbi:MAG: hypothetical protein LQ338_003811, partial [Usnochroma carphineum]
SQPPASGSTLPASQPPASQPPASQPPASQPPASQPPASQPPASESTNLALQPLPTGATVVVATINSQVISETFVPTTNPQFVSLTTTLSTFSTNSLGSTISYEIGPGGVEWQPLTPSSGTNNPDLPPPTVLPPHSNGPQLTPASTQPSSTATPSAPASGTATPGHSSNPAPTTTQPPSTGAHSTGPLPIITSYSSDFSSVATVVGITANTHISTSDGSHHGGIYPFVFGCWFCGGGGFVLWGMTLPGIYPPPDNPPVPSWPTITIGNDGDPTPDPSEKPTASQPSNSQPTQSQTKDQTTTASSCVSSAIPSCTQVLSVSASSTVTSTSCTTVFACSGTATTGASTTTATGGPYCSPGSCGDSCAPTAAANKKRGKPLHIEGRLATPEDYAKDSLFSRTEYDLIELGLSSIPEDYMQDDVWKRGYIENPSDSEFNNNLDRFITEQIASPGAKPLKLPRTNPDATAQVIPFDAPPGPSYNYLPSISSLEGCTAIIIIGEKGCWISHFWEQPWFIGYKDNKENGEANFQKNVLNPLENGNGDDMPSPFATGGQTQRIPELADGDNGFKPEIIVVTLQIDGAWAYDDEVKLMEQALTGEGKAFEGCKLTREPYVRNAPDSQSANGKVLIQYTNEQENDMGEPLVCPAQAYYRVWVQAKMVSDHAWPASGNQVPAGAPGKKKRQEPVCKAGQTGTFTATGTNTAVKNPTGTNTAGATGSSGPSSSAPPSGAPSSSRPASKSGSNTGTGPITTANPTGTGKSSHPTSTYKPPTCLNNPVDQDPPNCTQPPSTSSGPTSTYKPPTCMNNPVDQDPPNCTQPPTTSQPFSCSAGSNIGAATYDPATWCGCNSPTGGTQRAIYPTLPSGSGDAACAYTAPPSTTVNPTIVKNAAKTSAQPAPSSTTAVVLPTTTAEREPNADTNCAGGPDKGSQIFSCGGNQTLFQLFAPAGTPHSNGKAKDDVGGWGTYEGGGCYCVNGNFCCASDASVDTDLNLSFLQQINAPGGGNAVAFYQDLKGQCTCNG